MKKDQPKPLDPAALAKARADLAAAPGRRRLDLLLYGPNPTALVRALPADDLYFTIREIGLGDAVELVQLASAEQFRTFLDLEAWQRGELQPRKALPWLRAARAGSADSPLAAARWRAKLRRLDPEVLELALRDAIRLHALDDDPDPHLESDRFMRTPEGKYIVEFVVDGAEYMAIRGILDDLYAEDPFQATRLLSAIQWELPSELNDSALRWRTGRLADLGYPSLDEALSWFARPAPRPAAPAGAPARPAGFWLERLGTGSLLARAAARLAPAAREHLELELVTAANAVLVADAVDTGDLDAVRSAMEGARAFVEMGLEVEAGADEARAAEILATTAVKAVFQRGFGRVLELRWRAERLLEAGAAGTRETPLLDPPLGEAVSALAARRPVYFPGLAEPRQAWGTIAAGAFEPRPFRSSAEVARTAEALGMAEGLAALGARLGLAPQGPRAALAPRLSALYLTALANERLGRSFAPAPIPAAEVRAAASALADLTDPRLEAEGDAGRLLGALARARAEELGPVRDGAEVRPEYVAAIVVGS
jgi:hypothetical protein